jgi:hypothetical protein
LDQGAGQPAATRKDPVEAPMAAECFCLFQLPFVADRQLPPPAGAPARQHAAAVLCGHPSPEAVCVAALSFVWLKRALHRTRPDTLVSSKKWTKHDKL